jgi:hypothetical protein
MAPNKPTNNNVYTPENGTPGESFPTRKISGHKTKALP